MRHSLALLLLLVLTLTGTSLAAGPASADGDLPPLPNLPTAPEGDLPGVNDWSCRPSAAHPVPVVLVHGTFGDRRHLLERLALAVRDEGYCVYALDYGNRGTQRIQRSARQLRQYVDRVLAATGARKVSLVGHSQGGMMPRYYIKNLGGRRVVDDLVGLAPSNHGTALTAGELNPFALLVGVPCPACTQQGTGSRFLRRLNAGDETPGRVSYTQVTTRYDEVVVPHRSGYLARGPRTTNLTLQRLCPFTLNEHLTIPLATPAIDIVLDALSHRGPARKDVRPRCF
ncbi:MAG: lipase [Nocardioides sp.]|nr:lipase [Nocardioides sp.]